jgi:hypothetical protein
MIYCAIDTNEVGTKRAEALTKAIDDHHDFEFIGYDDLIVDVQFELDGNYFYVEIKEPADYISSILSGHLFSQVLTLREAQMPAIVVVLGEDTDINAAIKSASTGRRKSRSTGETIITYQHLVQDFEANSYALGIPCLRWKSSPWARTLSHADKILTGGDLLSHRPKPADHERQTAALCMCVAGVGPVRAKDIMRDYKLQLVPRSQKSKKLEEIKGIGPKTAAAIKKEL